jgi:Reverse transcriptase (RNA-dependent DNA polymerase)/Endonuclease/Exonuclease/phosphatase family
MFSLPHTANTPGGGLCTLISNDVARHAAIWRVQPDVDCLWVRIEGAALGLDAPLFIGNCYLPCSSSGALAVVPLEDRYLSLSAAVAEARAAGYVVMGGDLNAKVAHAVQPVQQDDNGRTSGPVTLARDMNESGRHLRVLCQNTGMHWLTGCVAGDTAAEPSFYHGNGQGGMSRIDHILVDPCLWQSVVSSRIRKDITGSDHYPVEGTFDMKLPCRAVLRAHGSKLRWCRDSREAFIEGVASELPAIGELCNELESHSSLEVVQGVLHKVVDVLVQSALQAGCKQSYVKQPTMQKAAWFDRECLEVRQGLRKLSRRRPGSAALAQLRRSFRSLCKKKKKMYSRGQIFQMMDDVKSNPRSFWKHFKSKVPQSSGDVAGAVSFWSSLLNKDHEPGPPLQEIGSLDDDPTHELNRDITGMEVSDALSKLKTGTASGPDGLPPELFKHADVWNDDGSSFAEHLACIFNHMFRTACVPSDWGTALLTLVYKSGGRTDWGNYRPLAVMQAIAKVFASVLNMRLMAWAEANGIRAKSQAGFRPKYSTSMQAFVLSHLIEQHRHQKTPLYVCFVDFKKAYDSVPRDKLWKRLYDKGVTGRMLSTLQALYANVSFSIKFPEGISDEFSCNMGVRQGCPLSPFLFGVYIEMLDEQLRDQLPMAGPILGGSTAHALRVPLLLYADDLCLIGCSHAELQLLLDQLSLFSESSGMQVNMSKTKIVVFKHGRKAAHIVNPWVYRGTEVEVCDAYKYLGLCFYGVKPLACTVQQQVAAAKRSLGGMQGFYKQSLAEMNVWLMLSLFKAVVMPSLLYGCEVWGAGLLSRGMGDSSDEPSRMRLGFFRRLLGVRKSTASLAMLRELGEYPLHLLIVRQLVKFWNKVMTVMPPDSLIYLAMMSSRSMALEGQQSWFGQLHSCLQDMGCSDFVYDVEGNPNLFDVSKIVNVMRGTCHASFRYLPYPHESESHQLKLSTYHNWFASPLPEGDADWVIQGYLRKCVKYDLITKVSRFRLGSHNLRIEREKWKRKDVQVAVCDRHCLRCHQGIVDDEYHAVFQCGFFAAHRVGYPALFEVYEGQKDMNVMFNDVSVTSSLARFLDHISVC